MRDPAWKKLRFMNPGRFLLGIEVPVQELGGISIYDAAKRFNNRQARPIEEDRRCAILCHGISVASGRKVLFSSFEASDYDYVLAAEHEGHAHYIPLQMKQLVPESKNPTTSLQAEIDKLKKYATSSDLVVAIHINRRVSVDLDKIDVSNLTIHELWLFGPIASPSGPWCIIGDIKKSNWHAHEFALPLHA